MSEADLWREIERLQARLDYLEALESLLPAASGTWTTSYKGSGTAGVFTYTSQAGYYVKLDGFVLIWGRCAISAINTPPTGTMTIEGLPVACNGTYAGAVEFGTISQFNYTAAALDLTGAILAAASNIDLRESFDNATFVQVPAANFTNNSTDLRFAGMYLL